MRLPRSARVTATLCAMVNSHDLKLAAFVSVGSACIAFMKTSCVASAASSESRRMRHVKS